MSYEKEIKTAFNAVKKACNLCSKAQKTLISAESVEKKDRSPVTIADFGSQAVINLAILESFPGDSIVGEEDSGILRENDELRQKVAALVKEQAGDVSESRILEAIDIGTLDTDFKGRFWTVDPIDGTKGFLRGEQYAVALALVENGKVIMGFLGCPNFPLEDGVKGGIFQAVRGMGAFVYPLNGEPGKRIYVCDENAENSRFCESVEKAHASHDVHAEICKIAGIKAPPFRIDSQAKYAAVASGRASVYLRLPRTKEYREKIWDHAAGSIVVEEAGGRVTDFSGQPLNYSIGRSLKDNVGILATNGSLHEDVLRAIAKTV